MCLTIPKKVVDIKENSVIVEDHVGNRHELKTLIKSLQVGDFVISQQNMIIEKLEKKYAQKIFTIISGGELS